jgi:hypothetical protein
VSRAGSTSSTTPSRRRFSRYANSRKPSVSSRYVTRSGHANDDLSSPLMPYGRSSALGVPPVWCAVTERRVVPLPKGWQRKRARILRLYGRVCYRCGTGGATEVDHVIPASRNGGDDDANLRPIHHACHLSKTAHEARGEPRARRPEPHPGDVVTTDHSGRARNEGGGQPPATSASHGAGTALSTGPESRRQERRGA